ncbi:hypothetical protein [Pseudonocardia sp. D17]|uniref:hypothetical protein n=1 Tax=Pseudonocardia sp. D17 TaxID=882661 RepID=UPI002B3FB252|nr:hypothetical protein PSD17_39290 [Pseudonocardia sp. D17]
MSLATNVTDLATRVATEAKSLRTLINGNNPDLATLTTTAKANLVAAINEVAAAVAGASGIDDGTISTSTSWSSQKTRDEIDSAVAGIDFPDVIDDTTPSTSTAYSSTKTDAQIAAAVGAIDVTDVINDAAPSTTSVYSSTKTDAQISAAVAAIIDTAPGALDTLNELAAALGDDPNFAATINAALGNRVRVDAAQSFTAPQQAQGRANIGAASDAALTALTANVGDTNTNFVTTFEAGLT